MGRFITFILPVFMAMSFTSGDLKPVDTNEAVTFTIKNFGINTSGGIKGLKGIIKWDPANPSASVFNVSVDVSTINTGIEMRDSHLKKDEYFDVEKYPDINFVSTAVTASNLTGNLTIKGVTKQVSFPFTVKPSNGGFLFEGTFSINRKDFGIGGGSVSLSNSVKINLKVQAK